MFGATSPVPWENVEVSLSTCAKSGDASTPAVSTG
jgi:hypothetical protein